jgi:hypothetical protein
MLPLYLLHFGHFFVHFRDIIRPRLVVTGDNTTKKMGGTRMDLELISNNTITIIDDTVIGTTSNSFIAKNPTNRRTGTKES